MEDSLLGLVGSIYQCALDPARWGETLEDLGDRLGGAAFVMSVQARHAGMKYLVTTRQAPEYGHIITENFATAETNPLVAAMPGLAPGEPTPRASVCADDSYFRGNLWGEVFRPQGLAHRAITCVLRDAEHVVPMGILREPRKGDFSNADYSLLRAVMPHMQRAMLIALRVATLEDKAALGLDSLDRLPLGVIVTDARCRVRHLNWAARRLAEAGDGLLVRCGRLCAERQDDSDLLEAAIARATARRGGISTAVAIARRSGRRPLALLVAPGATDCPGARSEPGALILVNDPERRASRLPRHLSEAFALSPAEAQLAAALLDGKSLEEVAALRGISQNTVKTQMKAIFAKTETSRQADLLRRLSAVPEIGG